MVFFIRPLITLLKCDSFFLYVVKKCASCVIKKLAGPKSQYDYEFKATETVTGLYGQKCLLYLLLVDVP